MMNFGDAEVQTVVFSPALPNHGAFFFHKPARFVGKPVNRADPDRAAPPDLLVAQFEFESEATSQPDFFLKPVAASAARLAPRLHWAVSSKLDPRNGYILANRERPLSISR